MEQSEESSPTYINTRLPGVEDPSLSLKMTIMPLISPIIRPEGLGRQPGWILKVGYRGIRKRIPNRLNG